MLIYYIVAAIIIGIDQWTKRLVVNHMELGESISVIGTFFELTSHRNRGAAFGILQDQRWFFIAVTSVVIVGLIWYIRKIAREGRRLLPFALGLVLGGAAGNFIDRLLFGEVVDFFDFHFKLGTWLDYPFAIFNVADSAIVCGVALIFVDALIAWRQETKAAKAGNTKAEGEEVNP